MHADKLVTAFHEIIQAKGMVTKMYPFERNDYRQSDYRLNDFGLWKKIINGFTSEKLILEELKTPRVHGMPMAQYDFDSYNEKNMSVTNLIIKDMISTFDIGETVDKISAIFPCLKIFHAINCTICASEAKYYFTGTTAPQIILEDLRFNWYKSEDNIELLFPPSLTKLVIRGNHSLVSFKSLHVCISLGVAAHCGVVIEADTKGQIQFSIFYHVESF